MAKLKLLSMHKLENVPDHIIEEIRSFSIKLTMHNLSLIRSASPNIALGALNWMLPALIKDLVTNNEDELRKAVRFSCEMLIQNMEILIKQMKND